MCDSAKVDNVVAVWFFGEENSIAFWTGAVVFDPDTGTIFADKMLTVEAEQPHCRVAPRFCDKLDVASTAFGVRDDAELGNVVHELGASWDGRLWR